MGKFIGRNILVGIAKEASRGVAATPTLWPELTINFDDKYESIIDEDGGGRLEGANESKVIKKYAAGDLSGAVRDKTIGLILLSALGEVSSATKSGESTVYEHTFSVAQNVQHPSLTLEAKNPNEQLAFSNVMLDNLELSVKMGEFVSMKADAVGKAGAAATNTPGSETEYKFIANDVGVKLASNIAGLGAASAIKAKALDIKISKGVIHDDVFKGDNSIEPDDFNNTVFGVEGSLELNFDSLTLKNLIKADTAQAMRIEIVNTGITIGTASNPKIKIDLPKIKFQEWSKDGGLNDIIKQKLTFRAFYSKTDTSMISVVVTNSQASY